MSFRTARISFDRGTVPVTWVSVLQVGAEGPTVEDLQLDTDTRLRAEPIGECLLRLARE